jgi:hypothetical protein
MACSALSLTSLCALIRIPGVLAELDSGGLSKEATLLYAESMNWLERRALMERGIPEFWNVFCIEIEQTLAAFRKEYGQQRGAHAFPKRMGNCIHLIYAAFSSTQAERAIDICLDLAGRRVFSRIEGEEQASLGFHADPEGKPVLVDADGAPVTNDQASEFFLKTFLFPA